jgi:hypothetical protein
MSFAREMLDASPATIEFDLEEVAAAIDASMHGAQACTSCADSCLAEEDVAEMSRCILLCVSCSDICDTTARALSRPAGADHLVLHGLLQACVRTCQNSAEECDRHAAHHRHCEICARACRQCIQACSRLLEDEAFAELQKLAGG